MRPSPRAACVATAAALSQAVAFSQAVPADSTPTLSNVTVNASADASAEGLSPEYPGGQVARGGRAGILGTRNAQESPFSITSYTHQLIQDRQSRSVGEVLQNDPGVRVARGFGNFQEAYFIRGFILGSDDVAYNGLFSLLPRQYIATELFERVEVLRGASAFLTGANPGGGGLGGAVNLLPKRAPNEALTRVTTGVSSGGHGSLAADIARRFGPDGATGIRVNAAYRDGGTAVDDERARLGLLAVGLDWRSRGVRLSADIGHQDNRLRRTRPNVSLAGTVTSVPAAPEASANFAQPWSYSNERDVFGTVRGEWDLAQAVTAWAAYGLRRGEEANSLANPTVDNLGAPGAAGTSRFDNARQDKVDTAELGLRGKFRTGTVGHEWVVAASAFALDSRNAFGFDLAPLRTNIHAPLAHPQPPLGATTFFGGDLASPLRTTRTRLRSVAIGDTLSMADDRLLLTLGVRHQRLDLAGYDYDTGAQTTRYQARRNSPAAGIVWKAGKALSVYANYVEGLTQGETAPASAAGVPVANAGEALAPYVSKQKEVGLKYDGGSLGGSIALFSTSRPRAFVDAARVFSAAGKDRHDGVEFNVFGQATRDVKLLGGATWLSAKQRNTGSAATDGRRVIGVPAFQASAGAEWELRAVEGLALDVRAVHTGASYADAANTLRVPGWTRLDMGARYLMEIGGRLVSLRGRIDNVGDRNYWASSGGFPGAGYLVVGAPRTFSLSASVDF
ncbi:MAG TPA: TonB-dependent receptor [Ramlibacter sp.]|nr:TonB-dependent receptor [Ramlibacter sp.]